MSADSRYMREALKLAEEGWGLVNPNPMVGAVLVRDDRVIGRGFHRQAGGPHAEAEALRDAAKQGNCAAGATIYVTLEPCSTHGRTPPCTEALIAAGVKRAVVGCPDPNPVHAGRGVAILREAGIEVEVGIEQEACEALNAAFFHWIVTGRPLVLLKLAMTLDGKIATAAGESKWITGPGARSRVQALRRLAGAVLVGGETVRRDSPQLLVREPENWPRQPRRLVASATMKPEELAGYFPAGPRPELVALPDRAAWRALLEQLGAAEVTLLLVEGGGELAASALRCDAVDQVEFHFAPLILGGRHSRPAVGGADPARLADALRLAGVRVQYYGDDLAVSGRIDRERKKK